jgi:hypothetical protein
MKLRNSPCQADLDRQMEEGACLQTFKGTFLHQNPKFYKYYYWIYHRGILIEGRGFFDNQYRLPIKKAFDLIDQLKQSDQPCVIYNRRIPRWDPDVIPFDRNSAKWKDYEWAPAFDDDQDELFRGFK